MTDLERMMCLILSLGDALTQKEDILSLPSDKQLEFVAQYLLANGVILPPVTVGQTVYFMPYDEICEAKVIFIEINLFTNPQIWISLEYYSPMFGTYEYKSRVDLMLGKTVFLTREEAEAELERRRKEVKNE